MQQSLLQTKFDTFRRKSIFDHKFNLKLGKQSNSSKANLIESSEKSKATSNMLYMPKPKQEQSWGSMIYKLSKLGLWYLPRLNKK